MALGALSALPQPAPPLRGLREIHPGPQRTTDRRRATESAAMARTVLISLHSRPSPPLHFIWRTSATRHSMEGRS